MMQKTVMICENYQYKRLYAKGRSLASPCLALYWRAAGKRRGNRLGITATKKVGGAVQRNRARRVILEAYRLLEPELPGGLDLVIVARGRAAQVKMQVIKGELRMLMRKAAQNRQSVPAPGPKSGQAPYSGGAPERQKDDR